MISQSLVARIRKAFPEYLRGALVAALDEAYQEVSACHRPERGWNNFTFGTGVWTIAMFQLQELAREGEWELEEEVDNHRATFVKDGLHLSCYKVGSTADEDIFTSFPNNHNAAKRLVANNRQFDLFGDRYQTGAPVDLVLAHLGRPSAAWRRSTCASPRRWPATTGSRNGRTPSCSGAAAPAPRSARRRRNARPRCPSSAR